MIILYNYYLYKINGQSEGNEDNIYCIYYIIGSSETTRDKYN